MQANGDLPEMVRAFEPIRRLSELLYRGKQERKAYNNDGDNDQQL
jgi:hypothetical protein